MNILGMAIGGAVGTICRYGIGRMLTYQQFPFATLCINSVGSLLLGFLFVKYATTHPFWFMVLGIGFCGGFTTYSTFSLELYNMMHNAQYLNFTVYLFSTLILGIIAVFTGAYIAKLV